MVDPALICFSIWVVLRTPWVVYMRCMPSPPSSLGAYATILGRCGLNPWHRRNLVVALAWALSRTLLDMYEEVKGYVTAGRYTLLYASLDVLADRPYEQVSCEIFSAFFVVSSDCDFMFIAGLL